MPTLPEALATPTSAFEEGLRFFRGEGIVNGTLKRLAHDLEQHGIAYCVAGEVALNQHGYQRFTETIELLLSPEGFAQFQRVLVGQGYRPSFLGAHRKFRSTPDEVPIEVITSGESPGGESGPVRFPPPIKASVVIDGVRTLRLEKLIDLKIAHGTTAPACLKDLADVQELIRIKMLDNSFATRLDPSVRYTFLSLLHDVERARARHDARER